jgi:methylated-DNA-protein-cysteine methyltransferase-like protein
MKPATKTFSEKVYQLVSEIPEGKVMTYGQIAALCGSPTSARIVGQTAHFGPQDLPWHRVVKKSGGLASGYPGGMQAQKAELENEHVTFTSEFVVDVESLLYWPA